MSAIDTANNGFPKAENLRSAYLIETDDALDLMNKNPSDLRVVDAQWFLPGTGDAVAEHAACRMTATTQHIHLPDISDTSNPLPQMLCSVEHWTEKMKKHHIHRTDDILLYDKNGFFSVCRVALMFRYFGATRVRIINGGMKKWLLEHKPTSDEHYEPGQGLVEEGDYNYHVVNENLFVRNIDEVH